MLPFLLHPPWKGGERKLRLEGTARNPGQRGLPPSGLTAPIWLCSRGPRVTGKESVDLGRGARGQTRLLSDACSISQALACSKC